MEHRVHKTAWNIEKVHKTIWNIERVQKTVWNIEKVHKIMWIEIRYNNLHYYGEILWKKPLVTIETPTRKIFGGRKVMIDSMPGIDYTSVDERARKKREKTKFSVKMLPFDEPTKSDSFTFQSIAFVGRHRLCSHLSRKLTLNFKEINHTFCEEKHSHSRANNLPQNNTLE